MVSPAPGTVLSGTSVTFSWIRRSGVSDYKLSLGTARGDWGVAETTNTGISWNATGGTISSSGDTATYTAPSSAGTYTVTAASVADPTKSASATVY
jgi:L-asparaginase/Glu-tRNA(Gln) amidotransferase subunit D